MRVCTLLAIVFFSAFIASCSSKRDRYYSDHGDWDYVRLPLIKPYEAIQLNGNKSWFVQIQASVDSNRLFSAPNSQKINVINNMVFLYAQNTLVAGVDFKESWFVLLPGKKLEKAFVSHSDYLEYLDSLQIKEPKLYNIDDVAEYSSKHDTIDWRDINLHPPR